MNDIRADLYDANTVYVALDNHKYGDYKPYLLKSTNGGRSWKSIAGDLPDRHLVWRVVQDHVDKDLMFAATEFGLFFTVDGGGKWIEFSGGLPTISFRDVTIQRREEDIVAASFGRGFYILDDYTALRDVDAVSLEQDAMLFPGRKAWWYIERHPLAFSEGGSQGHSFYRAPNPPFGAVFTYYLKEDLQTQREARIESEKSKVEAWEDTPFIGYDGVEKERRETKPEIWLTVRDTDGNVVRRISGPAKKGFHRVAWDLRFPAVTPINSNPNRNSQGFLAAPGTYTVSLSKRVRGKTVELVAPQSFEVERLRRDGALPGASTDDVVAFWERTAKLQRSVSAAASTVTALGEKAELLKKALANTRSAPDALDDEWQAIRTEIFDIEGILGGNQSMNEVGQDTPANVRSRLGKVLVGVGNSTYGPTTTHRETLGYAEEAYDELLERINTLQQTTIPAFETSLIEAGGPWTPGGVVPPR